MKNKTILVPMIVGIVALFVGFGSGMLYQKQLAPSMNQFGPSSGTRMGENRGFGGQVSTQRGGSGVRMGTRPIMGKVLSMDEESVVVEVQDGGSKIVLLPHTANIVKTEKAQTSDMSIGQAVSVFGTQNADGSVTAQTIQLNPQSAGMFRTITGTQPEGDQK